MCTVTLVPHGGGLRVMANRDERHARLPASPPRIVRAGGALALLPLDLHRGGTWIAGTSSGLVFALLNGHGDVPAGAPSRGRLILELLDCLDLPQVVARAQTLTGRDWPPHRLIATDGRRALELRVRPGGLTTDAYALHRPLGFTSSSLGDHVVEPVRRALFEQLVVDAADRLDGQDAFHRHRWPDRPHLSVDMHRHDAGTQSVTTVDVTPSRVRMRYEPLRELVGVPAWLSVERRATGLVALAS
jgi:hypothetical protein